MPAQRRNLAAGSGIPDPGHVVDAARREPPPVGRERHGVHGALMPSGEQRRRLKQRVRRSELRLLEGELHLCLRA